MGEKANKVRKATARTIRSTTLSESERAFLRANAAYEGSPFHKKEANDFGLIPPAAPRPDKTLCDEAGVMEAKIAAKLFRRAIDVGLVSEATLPGGFPKQLWVVDDEGRVFETIYGGSRTGRYHGYPIRHSDPLFDEVLSAWTTACQPSNSK